VPQELGSPLKDEESAKKLFYFEHIRGYGAWAR